MAATGAITVFIAEQPRFSAGFAKAASDRAWATGAARFFSSAPANGLRNLLRLGAPESVIKLSIGYGQKMCPLARDVTKETTWQTSEPWAS